MKCLRCDAESTGIVIQLCDEHFDEWEREVDANPKAADIAPIDPRLRYQSGGGTVPDGSGAVVLVERDAENQPVGLTVKVGMVN